MAVVPMGFKGSVSIVQAAVRNIVFKQVGVQMETEVRRDCPLPAVEEGLSLIYLDSFDYLRALPKFAEGLVVEQSAEHRRFVEFCRLEKLPSNVAKELVCATAASLQGGLLDGVNGTLLLHPSKGCKLFWQSLWLMSKKTWDEAALRQWCGRACFAGSFRRPFFSILQVVFHTVVQAELGPLDPCSSLDGRTALDEM
eukprot:3075364-Amphidinium_carterae.1